MIPFIFLEQFENYCICFYVKCTFCSCSIFVQYYSYLIRNNNDFYSLNCNIQNRKVHKSNYNYRHHDLVLLLVLDNCLKKKKTKNRVSTCSISKFLLHFSKSFRKWLLIFVYMKLFFFTCTCFF